MPDSYEESSEHPREPLVLELNGTAASKMRFLCVSQRADWIGIALSTALSVLGILVVLFRLLRPVGIPSEQSVAVLPYPERPLGTPPSAPLAIHFFSPVMPPTYPTSLAPPSLDLTTTLSRPSPPHMPYLIPPPPSEQNVKADPDPPDNVTNRQDGCKAVCSNGGCMPTVYIIGSQKGGTTSLFDHLESKGFCGPRHNDGKESHYLMSTSEHPTRYGYTHIFPEHQCASGCWIDATPNDLPNWQSPITLTELTTPRERQLARFVVVLREPVARDLSWFNHRKSLGGCSYCGGVSGLSYPEYAQKQLRQYENCHPSLGISDARFEMCPPFGEGILYGAYWPQLRHWKKIMPESQFFIAQTEWMLHHDRDFKKQLYKFIGIEHAAVTPDFPHTNALAYPGKVSMSSLSCDLVHTLHDAWDPWNKKLFEEYPFLESKLWSLASLPCTSSG
ncbi:hypothetical protein AB1Y20_003862 [Prymnesium parvum]|uniref:Sulfotransferase domain-containing protein n=1 Tax=Prymnesium parvum TaxID=97485 RepID=A0AB34J7V7_PRYPA